VGVTHYPFPSGKFPEGGVRTFLPKEKFLGAIACFPGPAFKKLYQKLKEM